MSEENLNKKVQENSVDDLVNVLQNDFASSALKIYVNSLRKEITFREITVKEQKSLTRIMSANERRKDIVYDAQCAMINQACMTDGFDVRDVLEFDRLKLMLALYQSNMSTNKVTYVCEECGATNTYQIDYDNVIHKLDSFELADKDFHYENKKFSYDFVVAYPSVKLVSEFYASYARTHTKNVPKREIQTDENMQNMEYINLFIKSVKFSNKDSKRITDVDFSKYTAADYEKILSIFPQDVLYSEEGVLKFIITSFVQPINDSFDKHQCYNCGTIHEKENASQAESFF